LLPWWQEQRTQEGHVKLNGLVGRSPYGFGSRKMGHFDVLSEFLNGTDRPGKVSVAGDEDSNIVDVPDGHAEHVHCNFNVYRFFDKCVAAGFKTAQAHLEVWNTA